jgi:hypothetical protein
MSAFIYRSGQGNVKLSHSYCKFVSVVAKFLNFFCWHISEQGFCPLQVGVLGIPVLYCLFKDTITES